MRFEIDFTPTKRRPRIKSNGQSYDPKENQREKRAMVAAFKAQCGAVAPLEGAVSAKVDIYRRMPKNRPKKLLRERDTYKPDADNIAKAVLDAMNGLAFVDDSQVVSLSVTKHDRTRRDGDMVAVEIEEVAR